MTGTSYNLLRPGSHRAQGLLDDHALVAAMLQVEVAWFDALVSVGVATKGQADIAADAAKQWQPDIAQLAVDAEAAGNPVVALVKGLRAAVTDPAAAALVHRGLTSQDVLDTALMLLTRAAFVRIEDDLRGTAADLANLVRAHRHTVMAGRTLTQYAVPITFGLKAAQWLSGILDAVDLVQASAHQLPVQCGGAAGTLALAGELTDSPLALAHAFAAALDLRDPGTPWHTTRTPVAGIGHALVSTCDALGVIASNTVQLGRPEVAEVSEGAVDGRGGSSTMPHKRNPVLGVLIRNAALQAPLLGAQLHLAAAQAVDERPDGAWHSEWSALRTLLELTVVAASQARELLAGLEVHVDVMLQRSVDSADALLAERGAGDRNPAEYLGSSAEFTDRILDRFERGANT